MQIVVNGIANVRRAVFYRRANEICLSIILNYKK